MMNFSTNAYHDSHSSKENIPFPNKTDALQVQRTKGRRVLGELSVNEQHGQSLSQGSQFSKQSSVSDSSQLHFFSSPSISTYDVYVEEACEVVLAASGEEAGGDSDYQEAESDAVHSEDGRLLLHLSASSCQDYSMSSASDESQLSKGAFNMEYAKEIHQNLRESEVKLRAKLDCLKRHPEITSGMRAILVDWLVEVIQEYKLDSETLHLAVNYLDRFLSRTLNVKRSKLQLLGTAALLIAAKYEEIFPPELDELVYMTDNTYTKKQLVRMEHAFLSILDFRMAAPTTNQFLHLFMTVHSVCADTENLALYIAELSLLETDPFLQYTPSVVAAGAYCLASYTISKSFWPGSLNALTGYTMDDIWPCCADLHKLYISAESHPQQAIREKYRSSKYHSVSCITPPTVLPHF